MAMKETEIGLLPDDWEVKTFGEIFSFIPNNTFSRDCLNNNSGEYQNVHYGDVLIKYPFVVDCNKESIPFVNSTVTVRNTRATLKDGDVVIADTAEDEAVGRTVELRNIKGKNILAGLHTYACRPAEGLFAPMWLGYFLNCAAFHDQLLQYIVGTKVSGFTKPSLCKTYVALPPLPEQRRIAQALSDIDSLITNLDALIAKKRNIKTATMQQLLSGKTRLHGKTSNFIETEIGLLPDDWEVISLADVGEIKMCKRIMKWQTSDHGDVPFYKIGTFGNVADAYITNELFTEYTSKYNYPKKGDILLSAAGTIGRTVIFDGTPSYFQDSNIVWIENNEKKVLNSLLYYIYDTIKWVTDTGTIPRIYNGVVREVKIAIPPAKTEQIAIATILFDIDTELSSLESELNKMRQIKEGMMQQLLTGKIRLSYNCK